MVNDAFQVASGPDDPFGKMTIKVSINGDTYPVSGYSVDVDSFFVAIGMDESQVGFIGSCGVPGCCGEIIRTCATTKCWEWKGRKEFSLAWKDIHEAASIMISEIENRPPNHWDDESLLSRLPFYRTKLAELAQLMTTSE